MIFGLTVSEYGLLMQRMMETTMSFADKPKDQRLAGEIERAMKREHQLLRASGMNMPEASVVSFVFEKEAFNCFVWHEGPHHVQRDANSDCDHFLGCMVDQQNNFCDLWACSDAKVVSSFIAKDTVARVPWDDACQIMRESKSLGEMTKDTPMELMVAARLAIKVFGN